MPARLCRLSAPEFGTFRPRIAAAFRHSITRGKRAWLTAGKRGLFLRPVETSGCTAISDHDAEVLAQGRRNFESATENLRAKVVLTND
jgi:hypothetical protein